MAPSGSTRCAAYATSAVMCRLAHHHQSSDGALCERMKSNQILSASQQAVSLICIHHSFDSLTGPSTSKLNSFNQNWCLKIQNSPRTRYSGISTSAIIAQKSSLNAEICPSDYVKYSRVTLSSHLFEVANTKKVSLALHLKRDKF